MEFATFPKNLAYNIKTLAGFSKTCVKLTPDRTAVKNGESFRVKLPSNTLIDLRTLCLYAKGTAERTSGNPVHFPRNTSSLIKILWLQLQVILTANYALVIGWVLFLLQVAPALIPTILV